MHGTTILAVRHNGQVALCGDGQATLGQAIVAKATCTKVRRLNQDKTLVGFAGATADAFAILELFENHLTRHPANLAKACVEMAKQWRMERNLRRLSAEMLVCDANEGFLLSGAGDVLSPDDNTMCTGSGGHFAQAAARAMLRKAPHLSAPEIARESLLIASEICVFTNDRLTLEVLDSNT
jgi:ATP-dependent HslUV protease subunit HslV